MFAKIAIRCSNQKKAIVAYIALMEVFLVHQFKKVILVVTRRVVTNDSICFSDKKPVTTTIKIMVELKTFLNKKEVYNRMYLL
jgi:hypothetical protein